MHICHLYNIGEWLGTAQPVTGGLIHNIWHIQTTQGHFAVKELNAQIMRKPNIRDAYRRSEQIAAQMAAAGIPALTALTIPNNDEGTVQQIDDITVIVYDWISGTVLASGPTDPEQARLIGQVTGQMHALNLSSMDLEVPSWDAHFDWEQLIQSADLRQSGWSQAHGLDLHQLIEWTATYNTASEHLNRTLVVSHRDLDQKNVLWRNAQSPILIDWESAGLTNPVLDIVGLAFNWAGWPLTYPEETALAACLSGYRSIYRANIDSKAKIAALHGVLGNLLGWLEFNIRRSINETIFTADERALGQNEVITALNGLQMLMDNFELWVTWLDRYL